MTACDWNSLPDGVRTATLTGSYGSLAALEAVPAHGAPVRGSAVLVPGFTGSKEDFLLMLPTLARAGYRAVAYDQAGQWQSDGPDDETAYTMNTFAVDLAAVAEQVGQAEPVHLFGHSFGGFVARAGYARAPQSFRSVTLLCSGPSLKEIQFMAPAEVVELIRHGGQEALWEQMRQTQAVGANAGQPRLEFVHHRTLATRSANLIGIMTSMAGEPDRTDLLASATAPFMIAYGTDDLWPAAVHAAYAQRIGARQAIYEGAGHTPNEDRPEQVTADLISFWECTEVAASARAAEPKPDDVT